jgi:oligopeptide transport system ATP-binding protein
MRTPAPRLEIQNLSVSFETFAGRVQAVRDVSLSLLPGETLAIVGESGSGKTVTCRAVMRLLAKNASIDGGKILLDGEDLLRHSPRAMRAIRGRDVSMVFQDPMTSLDPTMKVGKQVQEAIALHLPLRRGQAKARAVELLGRVGIEDPAARFHQYPHQF